MRESKLSPKMFIDNLIYNTTTVLPASLNSLCVEIRSMFGLKIARQSLSERYSEKSTNFLKEVLKSVSLLSNNTVDDGWFGLFKSIRIKDSTKFVLPSEYEDQMPGFKSVSSESAACIQFEYDLKSGTLYDLSIGPGSASDAKNAAATQYNVSENDLIIRDLGYFSTDVITNFIAKKAYFISKLNTKSLVYEMINGNYVLIDFGKLYRFMITNGIEHVDKQVCIGSKTKLPVRIIISLMPTEIYEDRIRKANQKNKEKGYNMTDEHKTRQHFNLIITNITEDMIPKEAVISLYHMRWQVELVFKIWKSTFGIHKTGKMKYHRWLSILYAKLILIIIYWKSIMGLRADIYKQKGKLISMDKCFKTLKSQTHKLRQAMKEGGIALVQFEGMVHDILSENHWLEKKKNKLNFEQIMYIMYCKSSIYVYI